MLWILKILHDPKYLKLGSMLLVYEGHAGLLVSTVCIYIYIYTLVYMEGLGSMN